jgi:hypothetical protein
MTTWPDAQTRHDLWLRLMSLTDELQHIAEQWVEHDLDLQELEDINAAAPDQYELPLSPARPSRPGGTHS